MKPTTLTLLLSSLSAFHFTAAAPTLSNPLVPAPAILDTRDGEAVAANVQEKRVAMPTQAASSGSGVTGNPNKAQPANEAEIEDPYGIVWDYVDACRKKVRRGEDGLVERCE